MHQRMHQDRLERLVFEIENHAKPRFTRGYDLDSCFRGYHLDSVEKEEEK